MPSSTSALSPTEVRRIQDEEAYPWIITQEIGKGSFATVYKGYHTKSRKVVAIKTVSRSILTNKLLENLESEISILTSLKHKGITDLKDIVKARNNIYLIMEFCSGGDLSKYIRHRGRIEGLEYAPFNGAPPQYWPHPKSGGLDPVVVRCFLGQLASSLKFLRERNLIHRDIKPQNLLLEPSTPEDAPIPIGIPLLKIADFGFARSLPNAALAETLCGSPLYMAPEILRYEKYDAKADLWSVGAVLYEMSVGRPPFRAQNHMELLKKIEHARGRVNFPDEVAAKEAAKERGLPSSPRTPSSVPPSSKSDKEVTVVPPDMKVLIRMLLKRKPIERASFEEFFSNEAVAAQLEIVDRSMTELSNGSTAVSSVTASESKKPPSERSRTDTNSSETSSRRRDKMLREQEKADKEGPPLEGTPYDPKNYVPQPAFKFRRTGSTLEAVEQPMAGPSTSMSDRHTNIDQPTARDETITTPQTPIRAVGRSSPPGDRPGAADDMSASKPEKEYVLVADTRAVEQDRMANELASASKRHRASTTGVRAAVGAAALTKQMGKMVIGAAIGSDRPSLASPPKHLPSTPAPISIPIEEHLGQRLIAAEHSTPPFARRINDTTQYPPEDPNDQLGQIPMTFPPPPNPNPMPSSPSNAHGYLSDANGRSHPSALVRAINLASKKLFGSPTHVNGAVSAGINDHGGSPRAGVTFGDGVGPGGRVIDNSDLGAERQRLIEAENQVLVIVENIAQKAQVLKDYADTKYAKVEATPTKPVLDPSHFTKKKGEPSKSADSRRKMELEADQNAAQGITLYLGTMSFCQKGINELNVYCNEHLAGMMPREGEVNTGIDDALVYFHETFKSCVERSDFLKAWLPEGRQPVQMWIDRIVYDHALVLMRQAASKELLEENFLQVEKEYEKALWMLYAIGDDVLQEGNPYREQDVATINGFIENTKTRLMRLRRRIEGLQQRP
ncbi:Serine/threonine-protein kinase [Tulasnella sp. JGI-2019a]|nr:Serine/threonine-protein kinase [Tulasnella sp. JGI-2019a]KAG8997468.1 Serine/threonine-protein kinase [Tulasnella sp. JGI-2019a]